MDTNKQLGEISRIMADGYHFVNLRFLLEGLPEDAAKQEIKKIVEQFYKLCIYAEKLWYNKPMNTQYTTKEIAKFVAFAKRHELRFNNIAEFNSAIRQFFMV